MGGGGEGKARAEEAKHLEGRRAEAEAVAEGWGERAEAEAKAVREKAMARLDEAVALVLKEVLP